ncbi:MAG: hypothetical protein HYY17_08105 [Planctomycetes bacterium]|nr:hypothetical protein [Planctomycetota bacterium]
MSMLLVVLAATCAAAQESQETPITLPKAENAKKDPRREGTLTLSVRPDGSVACMARVLFRPSPLEPEKEDWGKLRELFDARRQMRMWQEKEGSGEFVKYAVRLYADRSVPFQYAQFILMHAAQDGGVTRIEIEARGEDKSRDTLFLTLPRDKGIAPDRNPELNEVRIVLCAAGRDKLAPHLAEKERHDADLERAEQADLKSTAEKHKSGGHLVLNDVCSAWVQKAETGTLHKTWVCAEASHLRVPDLGEEKRAEGNRSRYRDIAAKTKEISDKTRSTVDPSKRAPIILDADGAVAWEHVVGVVDALAGAGIEEVQLVGNPRYWRRNK